MIKQHSQMYLCDNDITRDGNRLSNGEWIVWSYIDYQVLLVSPIWFEGWFFRTLLNIAESIRTRVWVWVIKRTGNYCQLVLEQARKEAGDE